LTARARVRREGAAALPFGLALDVRADGAALAATLGAVLGGTPHRIGEGNAGGFVVDAPVAAPHPTGTGGRWLVAPAGVGRTFGGEGGRAWRITSPVLRGGVDTRADVVAPGAADGASGGAAAATLSGRCYGPGSPAPAAPLPAGLEVSALPGIGRVAAALRALKSLRVAQGASLTVTVGVAGATLRQVVNLAATVANAGPYLDAALHGLDATAYLRDRMAPARTRPSRVVRAAAADATDAGAAPAPRAPRKSRLTPTPGTTPERLVGVVADAPVVRQVVPAAVEALRSLVGRRGKVVATDPAVAAEVAALWATETRGETAAPCILDLGQLARGVVVFRLPATVVAPELRAWVEAVVLFVGRALASAHVRTGTNTVDTQSGPSRAARLAQGLRRLLHDAGMVGRDGAPAVARAWLLHRVTGPTEATAQGKLRARG
jgi:hypothetical protein